MDIEYLLFLQNLRELSDGVFDSFMLKMTEFGEPALVFLLLAFIYWCVDKRAGQLMGLNFSVACAWNDVFKKAFGVERPWVRDGRIEPVSEAMADAGGFSMPGSHSTRAVVAWGPLGYWLWSRKEKALSLVCCVLLFFVLFSRNYLGINGLSDVLVSLALGAVLIFLSDRILDWAEGGKNRDLIIGVTGCVLCLLSMIWTDFQPDAGAGAGFFAGWMLERHFIQFEIAGGWKRRCVRFSIGAAVMLFILNALPGVLGLVMETGTAEFCSMLFLALFITAIYPFFFKDRKRYMAGFILLVVWLLGLALFSGWKVMAHRQGSGSGNGSDSTVAAVMEEVSETGSAEESGEKTEAAADSKEAAESEPESENGETAETESEEETLQQPSYIVEISAAVEERQVQIIGHRGYSSVFPENTLASFAGAIDIGADYVELDVQMSKDGQIVVCHDEDLMRVAGVSGSVADYTLEELKKLDVGSWFSDSFAGETMPTLAEALALIRDSKSQVYLELKDIGEAEGFAEAVLDVTGECGMTERCVFASFRYEYLVELKELEEGIRTLYNTASGRVDLAEEFPADIYGLYSETITAAAVKAIHLAGKQVFVWTVDTPEQMSNMKALDVDGICTNRPGLAKVALCTEYGYLINNFESSITVPGLYEPEAASKYADKVVRGFTQAGNYLVVSACGQSEEENCILYLMNLDGELQKIVDLGFGSRTGSISYDEAHDLLWMTGSDGLVYAVSWNDILTDNYQEETQVSFDAGLVDHNQEKVASFLTVYGGRLFVGSCVDGAKGLMNCYDLTDAESPQLLMTVIIPERICGITFQEDVRSGMRYLLMSQGKEKENSSLLCFAYKEYIGIFDMPSEVQILPEGAAQLQMTARGLYILFSSASRPYRENAGIVNDQIYLIRK